MSMQDVTPIMPMRVRRCSGQTGVIDAFRPPNGRENWIMYRFRPDVGGQRRWISAISWAICPPPTLPAKKEGEMSANRSLAVTVRLLRQLCERGPVTISEDATGLKISTALDHIHIGHSYAAAANIEDGDERLGVELYLAFADLLEAPDA